MALSLIGAQDFENTAVIGGDPTLGNPIMLLPGSATFNSSTYGDQATMDAAILAATKKNTGDSQKLFPFPTIQGTNDTTEAATFGTLGYGLRVKLRRSKAGYEFDMLVGKSAEARLMSFDGEIIPLLIFDDKSQITGVLNAANQFTGANYQISVEPQPFGDAQNIKVCKVSISIVDARDFAENAKIYKTALSTAQLTGLKPVNMRALSNVSNVWKIKLEIPTALLGTVLDIFDDYGSAIAALTFTAFTGTGFATSLAITSVAVDNTLKALTVTFDSTAYTALSAGAKIKLVGPTVTALDGANATGIEILPLVITK